MAEELARYCAGEPLRHEVTESGSGAVGMTTLVLLPPHSDGHGGLAAAAGGRGRRAAHTASGDGRAGREALRTADAAYGVLPAELLRPAERLRWLQAPQAGPDRGFYHQALVEHPVQVTNMRDTYTDHVATHTVALVLAVGRGLPRYVRDQERARWAPDREPGAVLALAEATALVVGVGAVGAEVGRLLAAFGTRVVGVDARRTDPPPGFAEIHPAGSLDDLLPDADLVIITVPQHPADRRPLRRRPAGPLRADRGTGQRRARPDGPPRRARRRAGAGAPGRCGTRRVRAGTTPADHPLWTRPDVLLTPHVAGVGPHADERRFAVLLENARRFATGRELINVVDKASWF